MAGKLIGQTTRRPISSQGHGPGEVRGGFPPDGMLFCKLRSAVSHARVKRDRLEQGVAMRCEGILTADELPRPPTSSPISASVSPRTRKARGRWQRAGLTR